MDILMPRLYGYKGAAHSPNNFSVVLSIEVETELADTLIYLIRLVDKLDIDLLKAAQNKIEINEQKYPVENAKKYTELDA